MSMSMSSQPVVAHALQNYIGHSETFIYRTLRGHTRYYPVVLTRSSQNREQFPFRPVYSSARHDLLRRPWYWLLNGLGQVRYHREWYLEHMARRAKARLLHAHFGWEAVSWLAMSRRLGIPFVVSFYGSEFAEPLTSYVAEVSGRRSWQAAYSELFEAAEVVIGEGSFIAERIAGAGCPRDKIRVVHIGVEPESYPRARYSSNGNLNVLFCGRFVEKKGLSDALRAVALAKRRAPKRALRFRVIGDGELRESVQSLIHAEGLDDNVSLLGQQPHAVFLEELRRTDVLLQPSHFTANGDDEGGAPTVLIEAQAAGIPVVSTRHCDIPEVVRHGVTGFVVKERDVEAMACALLTLADDTRLRRCFGEAGIAHIKDRYAIRTEMEKLEQIYDDCLY